MRGLERRCQHKKKKTPVGLRCRVGEYVGGSWLQLPWSVRCGVDDRGWGEGVQLPYIAVGQEITWGGSSYRIYM